MHSQQGHPDRSATASAREAPAGRTGERRGLGHERPRAERLLAAENRVLSRIAKGASLSAVSEEVVRFVEELVPGLGGVVFRLDDAGHRLLDGVSSSLPADLVRELETIDLRSASPVSTAIAQQKRVEPVALPRTSPGKRSPSERAFDALCTSHGLSPPWVVPAISSRGDVRGVLCAFETNIENGRKLDERPVDEIREALDMGGSLLALGVERVEIAERLETFQQRYALAARGANDGLWDWDLDQRIVHLSPRWCALVGLEEKELELSPDHWRAYVHEEDRARFREELDAHLEGRTEVFSTEHRMTHGDGRPIWVRSRGVAVRSSEGRPTRIAGSVTDITKQRLAEERLRHDAFHDDLTGLPNRTLFMDHLDRLLKRAQITGSDDCFAVLFLDFDHFKRVNDSLGHLAGDQLLRAVSRRLAVCLRPSDTVARLGGDEFSILLDRVRDVTDATRVSGRIHQSLREPFDLFGLEVFVTVSIGIAVGDRSYDKAEDVLRDADTAMYRAKAAGRARHEVFDEAMHARVLEQLTMETDLRRALHRGEFRLFYQPILSMPDGKPLGFEVFTWWDHPVKGLLAPIAFHVAAEESGLIVDIGWWVFREACEQMAEWRRSFPGAETLSIHVNLSEKQLFQPDLVDRIDETLRATGLDPEALVLDIPENVIMKKAESSVAILGQLKTLPLRIHLDNFGTGYSSLGYLHRFQIDALKIDRSFIRHLRAEGENRITVRTIVTLAENLGMDVIAEGVETQAQLEELIELSCPRAQGGLFHEPMPPHEVEERVLAPRRKRRHR